MKIYKIKIIIILILFSMCMPNEYIDNIISGKILVEDIDFSTNKINNKQKFFLKGLEESNGLKAKEYFLEYYKTDDQVYDADASMKIAEYYYSEGAYLKSSKWYKKVSLEFNESEHANTAMSYYLNSLMIVGKKDSADYYSKIFKKKHKNLGFNNKKYIKDRKTTFFSKNNNINTDTMYSVQVGSFLSYQAAKKTRKILSSEGFLCRIDTVVSGYQTFYSVRIGNFKNKALATKEQKRLKYRIGIYDSIIVKIN